MTALLRHQIHYDLRALRRNRQASFSILLLPVVLLVIAVNVGDRSQSAPEDLVPGLIAFAVMSASFMTLVADLVGQREAGVLKRRLASPVPPWVLIAGRTLASVVAALAAAVLVLVVARNAYDVAIPSAALPGVVVTVVLGSAALSALAYTLASAIDAVGSTQPVVALLVLPLLVISGVLVPATDLPSALAMVARVFPLEHIAHGLRRAFDSGSPSGVDATDALVLAGWAAAGLALALHRFDWTPRRKG
jgi:ABC-2 type transport system permease protein